MMILARYGTQGRNSLFGYDNYSGFYPAQKWNHEQSSISLTVVSIYQNCLGPVQLHIQTSNATTSSP